MNTNYYMINTIISILTTINMTLLITQSNLNLNSDSTNPLYLILSQLINIIYYVMNFKLTHNRNVKFV